MHATSISNFEPTGDRHAAPPLLKVLQQCESLQALVDDTLQAPFDAHARQAGMRHISAKMSDIVTALHREVRHRELVDHQLAAAVEQQEASQHASLHDALTGLPNRALFQDRLDHGLGQARRHAWDLALMFIDLDNFKQINDDHGHSAGDAVLRTIADRLRANTRIDDTISRHGGDEFTYLALDIRDTTSVAMVAHKLIDVIGKPCYVTTHGAEVRLQVRASIGIAVFPGHGLDAEALIRSADSAMYMAKKSRAGYVFAR